MSGCRERGVALIIRIGHGSPGRGGAIAALTAKQRAKLRSLAHPLKPILQIGRAGVTPQAIEAVREAFNNREILKVKVLDSAPADVRAVGESLAREIDGAHLVQTVGHTAVLYRPDPEDPQVDLG